MGRRLFRLFRDNETRVHELNYLFWECTTRCNLHCRHCGSDCTVNSREKDMPLADFLAAIDTIPTTHRPKGFSIVLTGGEPLLRPDIDQVGRELLRRRMPWGMVSNGWFYDQAMQDRLLAAGMGALTISLDGIGQSHDWMRGHAGSYERALRAIRLAALMKFNYAIIEPWGMYKSEKHPWWGWPHANMTKEEVRRLVAIGKDIGITLIPQINCYGHASSSKTVNHENNGGVVFEMRGNVPDDFGD